MNNEDFDPKEALARYIELWERRHTEFDQLPDVERRIARGDYESFSSVDIELDKLMEEAQRNGFVFEWRWDGDTQDFIYTIEKMSLEDSQHILRKSRKQRWEISSGGTR